MVSADAYPTFELCDTATLLAKTAAREQKLQWCPEIPYCLESLPLPYVYIVQAGVSITHLTHLNKSERDIARPLTAPSLSKVTLLLMKNVKHPKLITIEIRRSSTIRMSRHHSNTLLREEKGIASWLAYL